MKIKKVNEIDGAFSPIKMLIYGEQGKGKTTFALSSPFPLLIDTDGGVTRANPMDIGDTVQVANWTDIEELLKEDLSAYKTIVIDTAGKLLDYITANLIKNNPKLGTVTGGLSMQGWGALKNTFSAFVKQLITMQKHIIFVAHHTEKIDGEDIKVRLAVQGSSVNMIMQEVDLMGYIKFANGKRVISFENNDTFQTKSPLPMAKNYEIPNFRQNKDFTCETLFEMKYKCWKDAYQQRLQRDKDISDFKELLAASETAEHINQALEVISKMKQIDDNILRCKMLLNDRSKELSLVFDKTTKKFVDASK